MGSFFITRRCCMSGLGYGQQQYKVKQYGKYATKEPGKDSESLQFSGKTRLRAVDRFKVSSAWTVQHKPILIQGKVNKFRLRTNTSSFVQSQEVLIKGEHKKIRLTAGNKSYTSILNK